MTDSPPDDRARPIRTLEDVFTILEAPRASFWELSECVRICRDEDDLDTRHRCAERALVEAFRPRPRKTRIPRVEQAAAEVITAHLSGLKVLDDLRSAATMIRLQADRLVGEVGQRFPSHDADHLPDLLTLGEMVLLLDDGTSRSLVTLSGMLRRAGSPGMAKESSGRSLTLEPGNPAALTTRAAACADLEEFSEAMDLVGTVVDQSPDDTYALLVLSRIQQETGRADAAYETANRAIELRPDKYTSHRLMSAAAALGDSEAFDSARHIAETHVDAESGNRWVAVLAIEVLIEHGDLEKAERDLRELENATMDSNSMGRLRRAKRLLREAWVRRQQKLDL